jgi:hypothetical protein
MWMLAAQAIGQAATSVAGTFAQRKYDELNKPLDERQTKMQQDVLDAQAEYENTLRDAQNVRVTTQVTGALNDQKLSYTAQAQELGRTHGKQLSELLSAVDGAKNQSLFQRIEAAGVLGQINATMAASGVTGTSAKALATTMATQTAYRNTLGDLAADLQRKRGAEAVSQVSGALASPRVVGVLAELNYGHSVPGVVLSTKSGPTAQFDTSAIGGALKELAPAIQSGYDWGKRKFTGDSDWLLSNEMKGTTDSSYTAPGGSSSWDPYTNEWTG